MTISNMTNHFNSHEGEIKEINLASYIRIKGDIESKINILRTFMEDYGITSLFRDALGNEKKIIQQDAYNNFVKFEKTVLKIPNFDFRDSEYTIFSDAKKIQETIRKSLQNMASLKAVESLHKKKRHKNKKPKGLIIYHGGAPGLGKRS